MADLIVIAYDSEEKAEAARNKVLELPATRFSNFRRSTSSRLATPWWPSVGKMVISN